MPEPKDRYEPVDECDCCEINDYGAPDDDPYGPCEVCGHAPEEHGG